MYPERLRLTGLRAGVAGVTALALAVAVFVLPAPRASAQSQESAGASSKHLAGSPSAPAFRAPAAAAAKALVQKYSPSTLRNAEGGVVTVDGRTVAVRRNIVVLIQNEAGQVTGTTTTAVLERLVKPETQAGPEPEMTEAQMREARQNEAREKAARGIVEPVRSPEEIAQIEARGRAERAEADSQASDLRGRLISIDQVTYVAGAIAPDPVTVYFITAKGGTPKR